MERRFNLPNQKQIGAARYACRPRPGSSEIMIIIIIIKEGIWKRLLLPISSNIALSYFFPLESLLPALICSSALQTGPPPNRPPLLIAFYFCRRLGTALSGAERGHPRKGRRWEPVYNPGFVRALFGNPSGERWSGQVGKHFSGGQIYGPKGGKKKNTKEEVVGMEGGVGGGISRPRVSSFF